MASRIYCVDNEDYQFDNIAFQTILKTKKRTKHVSISSLEKEIAERLFVSEDAVHKWHINGNGGPSDYTAVCNLAKALEIDDPKRLLNRKDEKVKMVLLTDRQKDAAKRIYDEIQIFLDNIHYNGGYAEYAQLMKDTPDGEEPTRAIQLEESINDGFRKIELVFEQEYFDLKDLEIYSELDDYIEMLYNNFDFSCINYLKETDNHWDTGEDYYNALIKNKELVGKHI